jgi:uncharacterized protein YaaQ
MKLIMAIVHDSDAGRVIDALTAEQFGVTRINTAGGFLKRGNATLLAGVEDEQVPHVMELINRNCDKRRESVGHAATVFVLGVKDFARI